MRIPHVRPRGSLPPTGSDWKIKLLEASGKGPKKIERNSHKDGKGSETPGLRGAEDRETIVI